MKVCVKKLHKDAKIPTYAKNGDAGLDLTAVSVEQDEHGNLVYHTGIAFAIPKGWVGLLFPRSSNAKKDLILTNSVGVLDSGYRGEVVFKYRPMYHKVKYLFWKRIVSLFRKKEEGEVEVDVLTTEAYEVGDRIGQIVIVKHPYITFIERDELSETERGEGGFGSSGE